MYKLDIIRMGSLFCCCCCCGSRVFVRVFLPSSLASVPPRVDLGVTAMNRLKDMCAVAPRLRPLLGVRCLPVVDVEPLDQVLERSVLGVSHHHLILATLLQTARDLGIECRVEEERDAVPVLARGVVQYPVHRRLVRTVRQSLNRLA